MDANLARRLRITALSNFTRSANTLERFITSSANRSIVTPQHEKVVDCFNKLEEAHNTFLGVATNIDIETSDEGIMYLDKPGERYGEVTVSYSDFLSREDEKDRTAEERRSEAQERLEDERRKREAQEAKDAEEVQRKEEAKRRFENGKAELDSAVESFQRMNLTIKETLEDASAQDIRGEWSKIDTEFKTLKDKLIETTSIEIENDDEDEALAIKTKFETNAEKVFLDAQKWVLKKLKDSGNSSSGGVNSGDSSSGGANGSSSSGSTKKELAMLPSFDGEEKKNPYLQFPVWKKNWEELIVEHHPKWRRNFLFSHLDDVAKQQLVGCEDNYEECMERLTKIYGNPTKVVKCVMAEVRSPKAVADGDYEGLVNYSNVLERNFNRLKSAKREHEMSNSTVLAAVLKKFPRQIVEKWNEFLTQQSDTDQLNSFPVLIEWINNQRLIWEQMVISTGSGSGRKEMANYGNSEEKRCYNCDKFGHVRKDCPDKSSRRNKGGGSNSNNRNGGRNPPKVKKFWCALHKGDTSKKCWSDSCEDLAKVSPEQRIKLLKENGDCVHCVGDHKSDDCRRKDRVCGGRKDDRGCTKSHKIHELFCKDAKVFSVSITMTSAVDDPDGDDVVLLIMQVRCMWKRDRANVFWDLGSTSNFVTIKFAKKCGFKGEDRDLNVTTLGNETKDLSVVEYQCSLRDADGHLHDFVAYGMESITGCLSQINMTKMLELFPHLTRGLLKTLERGCEVDVLIGMKHPSWHPERVERAKGGGDFWLYRGKFGSCLGGRYPGVIEETCKSEELFHVNQTYLSLTRPVDPPPHSLEFCEGRSMLFHQTKRRLEHCHSVHTLPHHVLQMENPDAVPATDSLSCVSSVSGQSRVAAGEHAVSVAGLDNVADARAPAGLAIVPASGALSCVSEQVCDVPVGDDADLVVGSLRADQPKSSCSSKTLDDGVVNLRMQCPDADAVPIPVVPADMVTNDVADSVDVSFPSSVVPGGFMEDRTVNPRVQCPDAAAVPVPVALADMVTDDVADSVDVSFPSSVVPGGFLKDEIVNTRMQCPDPGAVPVPVALADMVTDVANSVGVSFPSSVVPGGFSSDPASQSSDADIVSVSGSVAMCNSVSVPASGEMSRIVEQPCYVPADDDVGGLAGALRSDPLLLGSGATAVPIGGAVLREALPASYALACGNDCASDESEALNSMLVSSAVSGGGTVPCTTECSRSNLVAAVYPASSAGAVDRFPDVCAEPWIPGVQWRSRKKKVAMYFSKMGVLPEEELFFKSESLGTTVEPQCGGCQCSKCPIPGSKYSFLEQREFNIINKNLFRKDDVWYTEYPWSCSRNVLPKNDKLAFQSLVNLERMLEKNNELAEDFCRQIDDMVSREAAVILSEKQLNDWVGDYYYIPLVGVKGSKKWLRICFDASRKQGGYPCLNSCLFKGPDRFINNILSVLMGFRNGRVGAVADISKFHNQVRLIEKDTHMQRFLWRGMDKSIPPRTYAVVVNNFGVKPANCIATCALHQSADVFVEKYPVASQEIKDQTYVDDELVADLNMMALRQKTAEMDEITDHAGMKNKGWLYSGNVSSGAVSIGGCDEESGKVLGLLWLASEDVFGFKVVLHFSNGATKNKSPTIVVSNMADFDRFVPAVVLTRRLLLANVARIFDPVGFLCPIILKSKLLLRASWCVPSIGWDDPISDDLASEWIVFLRSLMELADLKFPRSLWPEEETVGSPMLVMFSDGATLAYGAAAYIRWELANGGFWSRLIMAKCKIAPKTMLSIPRMELNGAVMANRVKNFLVKDTKLEFSEVHHLVDSSTILGYVHKPSGNLKTFESIRVAEIQQSDMNVDGTIPNWKWIPTAFNPADWCTKPRHVRELAVGSFWECGPEFLRKPVEEWPVRSSYKKEGLEGEIVSKKVFAVRVAVSKGVDDYLKSLINRSSSWRRMLRVLVWMIRAPRLQPAKSLECVEIMLARNVLVKLVQKELVDELKQASEKGVGRFRKLAPVEDSDGLWRVGSRMKNRIPFTFDAKLPVIVPTKSKVTMLIMKDAHLFNHGGVDAMLARFRSQGFWAVKAASVAKKAKYSCVPCRKVDPKLMQQVMGSVPDVPSLEELHAWSCCQMDLFGPFTSRSDVISRATKKTWAVVIEDVHSGAVHLDVVANYSTDAVLSTVRRFLALRGRPGVIHTDPGSQLESASGKLESWWDRMKVGLRELGSVRNFRWEISPPNSPWRQGKAERRIGIVKRLLKFSVGDSKLTPLELQTALFECADICNERPLGLNTKPREDGTFDVITPNCLIHGRSGNFVPDDTDIVNGLPMAARYRLVHHVTSAFWKKWSDVVSPALVVRQKWHQVSRNVTVGDVVLICESSPIKAKYKLGVVDSIHPSDDGHVRAATIRYVLLQKNKNGEDVVKNIKVKRSVQRLAMILPVEEQVTPLEVTDNELFSTVKAGV